MNLNTPSDNNRFSVFPLLWLIAIPVLNLFYGMLNHPGDHVYSLVTDLDRLMPFVPAFIIPYVLWYPFLAIVLVGLAVKNRETYYRTLLAFCAGLVIAYAAYAVFQTTVPRPAVSPDGILNRIVLLVYGHDNPYNCFPSIHVLTSYLMLRGAAAFGSRTRGAVTAMSVLIIASTLFVKQHVWADLIGGILVGEFTFRAAGLLVPILRNRRPVLTDNKNAGSVQAK